MAKFVLSAFADEIGASLDLQIEWLNKTGVRFVEYRSSEGKNVSDHTILMLGVLFTGKMLGKKLVCASSVEVI